MSYLPDATDFTDMEKRQPDRENQVECPVCKGYGGWNLTLNAYGKGRHFRAGCNQCNGWGYVEAGSKHATCVPHDYREMSQQWCRENNVMHWGMCYHVYKCIKCDQVIAHDSSD